MNLRDLPHLARRFAGSLTARRPGPTDQRFVADVLSVDLTGLFHGQQPMDQEHAIHCARRVAAAAPDRQDLVRAALLHDVGKATSGLGVIGRSLASLAAITHLPRSRRMRQYLDHGALGAAILAARGESGIVTAFAAHHHGPPPPGIRPEDWSVLVAADRA